MAVQTGRTVKKWMDFILHDSGGVLRSIPIDSINGVGVVYDEEDMTAFQDALKNVLSGHGDAPIDITGPFDTSVAAAAGTLSGSHIILSALVGVMTPLSVDVQLGMRQAWEAGEPQYGITATATNGYIVTSYTVNPGTSKYAASLRMMGGSEAPAWGTAAES